MPLLSLDPAPIVEFNEAGLLVFRDNVQLNYNKIQDIVNKLDSVNIKDGSLAPADFTVPYLQMFGAGASVSPFAGAPAPTAVAYMLQASTTVVTTNGAGGTGAINFPVAFPNGLLSVVAIGGDFYTSADMICTTGNYSAASFEIVVLKSNGAAFASTTLRFNWIAIGW